MDRLVVSEFMTLDGVVEAPGGEFHPDGKSGWTMPHFTRRPGRSSSTSCSRPTPCCSAARPTSSSPRPGRRQTDEQGFADRMNSLPKYVASTTLDEPLEWNSTLIKGELAARSSPS